MASKTNDAFKVHSLSVVKLAAALLSDIARAAGNPGKQAKQCRGLPACPGTKVCFWFTSLVRHAFTIAISE